MTARETFDRFDRFVQIGMLQVGCAADPVIARSLLVTALIDEGGCDVLRANKVGHTFVQDAIADGPPYAEWEGTIADMPADIYDELKGRLK